MQAQSQPYQFDQRIRDWLQPALDIFGTHDIEDIEAEVFAGRMQLWVGERGALVSEIHTYPKKKALHLALAGGDLDQVLDFLPSLEAWSEHNGCTEMTLTGRLGWQRVLAKKGWTQTAIMMRCNHG